MEKSMKRFWLCISFFASGVSGLIYENLCARYLALLFGNTAYAHAMVLSVFMGGLALGSALFGKAADRAHNRTRLYVWIQLCVALSTALTPKLFESAKTAWFALPVPYGQSAAVMAAAGFIFAALIMLVPTALMGGTLPVLARLMAEPDDSGGKTVATLYYVNSLGAVMGSLFAGFYLIYRFGLAYSVTFGALFNLGAGLIAITMTDSDFSPGREQKGELKPPAGISADGSVPAAVGRTVPGCIFLSGFAAMLYEILWIRLFSIVLGSSGYSFALMLAAFIAGITAGSFVISTLRLAPGRALRLFGLSQIFIAFSMLASVPFYDRLPVMFLFLSGLFARTPQTFLLYEAIVFFACFMVMFLPAVFFGATFPLAAKAAFRGRETAGESVGRVYAWNTLGNILGASLAGLLILPALGLRHGFELGMAVNLAAGLILVAFLRDFPVKRRLFAVAVCALVFSVVAISVPKWDYRCFTGQIFRRHGISEKSAAFDKSAKIIFRQDDPNDTVFVVKTGDTLSLFVNGKADASTGPDMVTQILLAHLPLSLIPKAKNALIIGLGSGVTCGSALLHPLESLDVVEISRGVVEAGRFFEAHNYKPLEDPRLRLHVEDATTFVRRAQRKYDVIISEPSNPWISGIGSLFSAEFFRECAAKLDDGGLMAQWVQAYEIDDETLAMVVKTFSSAFPDATLWVSGVGDILLLGGNGKIVPDFGQINARFHSQKIAADLGRIGINNLFTLLSLQLLSDDGIRKMTARAKEVNSDYFPALEFRAPLALYTGAAISGFLEENDERRKAADETGLLVGRYARAHRPDGETYENLYNFMSQKPFLNKGLLCSAARAWREKYPDDNGALDAFSQANTGTIDASLLALERLIAKDKNPAYLRRYAGLNLESYRALRSFLLPEIFAVTEKNLKKCAAESYGDKAFYYRLLAKLYCAEGDYGKAFASFAGAEKLLSGGDKAEYAGLLKDMSLAYLDAGDYPKAKEYSLKMLHLAGEK